VGGVLVALPQALAAPATLSLARPSQVSAGAQLLVLALRDVAGATRLVLVARAVVNGDRIVSDTSLNGVPDVFEGLLGGGRYLVVFDDAETEIVCDYIRLGGDRNSFLMRFANAVSPGFDPDRDLSRIGLANQTTMLMSESLAMGEKLKEAMVERWGAGNIDHHYQAFDTICSATQDRQDAVVALLRDRPIDLMLVIGGYNSSNTANLARICADSKPTFHVADPDCLVSRDEIRHRPVGAKTEVSATGWLPPTGPVNIGLTSGASTPDNLVGSAVAKLEAFCGE